MLAVWTFKNKWATEEYCLKRQFSLGHPSGTGHQRSSPKPGVNSKGFYAGFLGAPGWSGWCSSVLQCNWQWIIDNMNQDDLPLLLRASHDNSCSEMGREKGGGGGKGRERWREGRERVRERRMNEGRDRGRVRGRGRGREGETEGRRER